MSNTVFYVLSAILSVAVLYGIRLMSKVKTAALGNRISAVAMLLAVIVTLIRADWLGSWLYVIGGLLIGTLISIFMTLKVKMIQMPQMVALLNGLGGLASALAALLTVLSGAGQGGFEKLTSGLAMGVGALTLSGSLIAALKLNKWMPQKPIVFESQRKLTGLSALLMLLCIVLMAFLWQARQAFSIAILALGLVFGVLFAIRVGGADMPITISLLNSTSGVAAAIAGMALSDVLLVAVGGIVGASGLLLTQIMCRSMNRSLANVLFGGKEAPKKPAHQEPQSEPRQEATPLEAEDAVELPVEEVAPPVAAATQEDAKTWLSQAKSVILIPGYGMALSQAQELVKQLADRLEKAGKKVRYAIHPVAGRMPGHMNVLLAEVDVDYDKLCEMETINPDFKDTDLVVVVGANDVINPAANTAQGTPIYGMPVLNVAEAGSLIICNFDDKPGYAGVPNPLYDPQPKVLPMFGDAKDSLQTLLNLL